MKTSDPSETIRAIFRSLHAGNLRLREPPTAKIDKRVLLAVFAPAKRIKPVVGNTPLEKPAPIKPGARGSGLRVIPRTPKK